MSKGANAKKINPKKALCMHEGCFEDAQVKGYCRKHFLSVLKGKAEGDRQPRGQLVPVKGQSKSRLKRDEAAGLDEVFSQTQTLNFESLGYRLEDLDSEIFSRSAYLKKVA
jgi:hypothetical protein